MRKPAQPSLQAGGVLRRQEKGGKPLAFFSETAKINDASFLT